MKSGRTLVELATEVQRQAASKKDALVQTQSLAVNTNGQSLLWLGGAEPFGLTNLAHRQMGDHLGIPAKWYDTMQGRIEDWKLPDGSNLFDTTVNTLLKARPANEQRLVRTLDGNARAFLSNKYKPIDNLPVLMSILPVLQDMKGLDWAKASLEVTDNKMYLQLVNRDLTALITGKHNFIDEVAAGIVISNSEVGLGAFRIQPMMWRLVCENGLIRTIESKVKYHVGGVMGTDGEAYSWLGDDTIQARSEATVLEMRDAVRAALDGDLFQNSVDAANAAAGVKMQGDPIAAVQWVTDKFNFNADEQAATLRNLIEGSDLSLWGMVNAVTATANTVESYDRAVELETMGGKLLDLPKHEVTALVNAN
jgi:hypothetical protein